MTAVSKPAVPCGRRRRPSKVSPSCEGGATISTSAGVGSSVFLPDFGVLWSSAFSSCPVCCMIHNSSFSSSLYDFIVFYRKTKKNKLKETQQTLRVKAQLAFFLPPSVGSLGSPLVFNKLTFSFCINTASKLAAGWLTWKRPYYRWFHKPALFVSWTQTFYTLLPAS